MMTKLTLRNLAAHRLRLAFTVVAVVLGVSFVAGTLIFRDTAARGFDAAFAANSAAKEVVVQPEQVFTGEDAPPRLVPASVLEDLRAKVPGAEALYGAVEDYAAIVGPDEQVVGGETAAHRGRSLEQRPGSRSATTITSGRLPSGSTEVAVEEHTAAEGAVTVGDTVTVVTRNAAQPMTVVGIFSLGEGSGFGNVVTYVGFAPEYAQELLAAKGQYTAVWLRPRAGVSDAEFLRQITAAVPAGYQVVTAKQQAADAKAGIRSAFDLLGRLLLAFAAVSVLVGSFTIFNTFAMLVAQRTRELALLRAIGAGRAQATRAVLGEAVAIGLIGSTLGLLTGVGVAVVLRALFERFGTDLPAADTVIAAPTFVWSYAVGMLVTLAAAYFPARRAGRVAPVAALRDDPSTAARSLRVRAVVGLVLALGAGLALAGGLASSGENGAVLVGVGGLVMFVAVVVLSPVLSRPLISLLGWPIGRLAGMTGRLSVQNARRNPRRSAATASALMVGLALVSMATVVAGSMSASTDERLDREFGADYAMNPRGLTGFSQEAVDRAAAVPGVRSVTPVRYGTLLVEGQQVAALVADPAALAVPANLTVQSGAATLAPGSVMVQQSAAEQAGLRVGSTVQVQYPDRETARLRVAGVFADNQVLEQRYIVTPTDYQTHVSSTLVQRAFVDLDDADLAGARIALQSALAAYPNIDLQDRQDAKVAARKDIDQALNIIMVLLLLSIAVAAVGIVNTLGLSVVERTREIGLLRAVGMSRDQVRATIRNESLVITLYGAGLGVALGVGLGTAIQRALAQDGIAVLDIQAGRLALYLVGAVVIGVVAAIWPAWRASRMNVLRAIQHE